MWSDRSRHVQTSPHSKSFLLCCPSKDSLNRTHISLVNIDAHKAQTIAIKLTGKYATVTERILTSEKLQDYKSFNHAMKITPGAFTNAQLKENTLNVTLRLSRLWFWS